MVGPRPFTNSLSLILACMAFFALPACGGGGGSGGGDVTPGTLSSWTLEGLRYESGSESGEVASDGAFMFESGKSATFRVGSTVIATIPAQQDMSLLDLAGVGSLPLSTARAALVLQYDKAFRRLTNMAVFLAFLDEDGDLSNGVKIPEAIHALAMGAPISLDQSPFVFVDDLSLRTLRRDGLQAGLWGGASKPMPRLERVLDALYQELGVVHHFHRTIRRETDHAADGSIDAISTFTFNAQGQRTESTLDSDANGVPHAFITYVYSALGQKTRAETRNDAGVLTRTVDWTYDPNGHLTRYEVDDNADGFPDRIETTTWNSLGAPASSMRDYDGDGTPFDTKSFTYRGNGTLQSVHTFRDSDDNGTIDSSTTETYNARGHLVLTERDNDFDGTIDQTNTDTVDAKGHLLERVESDNSSSDSIRRYTYDADGNRTTYKALDVFENLQVSYTYTYDNAGRLILQEEYSPVAGMIDRRHAWTFDVWGGLLAMSRDFEGDLSGQVYAFDADCNQTLDERVGGPSNVAYRRVQYAYDAQRWLSRSDFDATADGVVDTIQYYSCERGSWLGVLDRIP